MLVQVNIRVILFFEQRKMDVTLHQDNIDDVSMIASQYLQNANGDKYFLLVMWVTVALRVGMFTDFIIVEF